MTAGTTVTAPDGTEVVLGEIGTRVLLKNSRVRVWEDRPSWRGVFLRGSLVITVWPGERTGPRPGAVGHSRVAEETSGRALIA